MLGILNFMGLVSLSLGTSSESSVGLEGQKIDFYYSIFSGTSTYAVGPDLLTGGPAVPVYCGNSLWTASIPGATWIWDATQITNSAASQTVTFTDNFFVPCTLVSATLVIAVDNQLTTFTINGTPVTCPVNLSNTYTAAVTCDITRFVSQGVNKIVLAVQNTGVFLSTYQNNPAGLLYAINIHGSVIQ